MPAPFVPPENERAIGLGLYATEGPGVGGHLKEQPEDFVVREISLFPRPDPDGAFSVLRVVSRNWEQHELGARLAQRLHLPPNAISWAGTKDRRAVTERLASYRGPLPSEGFSMPEVEIVDAYTAREGLVLGHHFGNGFDIRLAGLEGVPEAVSRIDSIRAELVSLGYFLNYFGAQRFGEVRPVTHDVGRAIVRGDIAGAVETYLTEVPPGATSAGDEARREYREHHDAARALREFPEAFRFERLLLDRLARGQPPERALKALSRELRMLFVHAYQALLFNRWLTERLRRGLSPVDPVEGDVLLRVRRDGTIPGTDPVPVSSDNLPECTELSRRGRARLAGPLVGFATQLGSGSSRELLERLLAEEGITPAHFELPKLPEIASRGTYRPVTVALPPIGITVPPPEASGPSASVRFHFALPKGSYATVVMREFQKTGATSGVPSNRAY